MKRYLLIIIILLPFLVSCTNLVIITDPYWIDTVSEFQGSSHGLKFQSILNGNRLKFVISDLKGEFSNLEKGVLENKDNIYLLSPLLSSKVNIFAEADSKSLFYYFGSIDGSEQSIAENTVLIEKDRSQAFFKAGEILNKALDNNSVLPIIYFEEDLRQKREAMSFVDGVKMIDKNIVFLYLKVKPNTSDAEIRNFFNENKVKNSQNIVIFSDKWKNICYELAERDNKNIITSDSWFIQSYASIILLSIEDDIKGMLKKVYKNEKTDKHSKILLEGSILK